MAEQFIDKAGISILKSAIFGIIIFDLDFKTLFLNTAIEKLSGYPLAELEQADTMQIIINDPKYYEICKSKLKECKDKAFDDLDIKITKKNNAILPVHISGFHVIHEKQELIVMIIQDISNKKAFEKVLESSFDNFIQTTIDLDQALKKIKEQRTILEEYQVKMKRELLVAKTVQKAIIPKKNFSNEYIQISGTTIPSEELGGDYFDYFRFDNSKQGILIADVSGHGVPSALITTMIKVYFERYSREFVEAEKVFTYVNNEITQILQDTGFYFTSFYSVIDLDTMRISSASAGHDFALCYNPEENKFYELGKTEKGTIIGTFEEAEYESSNYQLTKGSRLIYFTDGITEARNQLGEFYGIQKVKAFIRANLQLDAKELITQLVKDIDAFYGEAKPNDDRTIIVVDILKIPDIKTMTKSQVQEIVDTAFRNGRRYIKQKQYSAAINEFEKILQFDTKSSGAYSYLGQISGIFGEFKKAEELLNKAIELNPNYIQGYYFLGIILFKQKKYREAKECWLKLKKLAGDFKNVNVYIKKIKKLGI